MIYSVVNAGDVLDNQVKSDGAAASSVGELRSRFIGSQILLSTPPGSWMTV